jgi:rhamnogalacturonyl hydrolase YesR
MDNVTSLCFHGWDGKQKNHMSGILRGRANAWMIYSAAQILYQVKGFNGRTEMEVALDRHVRALEAVQRDNAFLIPLQ